MDRPTHRQARLMAAIVATAVASIATFGVLPAATATADAPADDEYLLQLPGARQTVVDSPASSSADEGARRLQRGVAGEADPPQGGLALLGSTITDAPGAAAAGLAILVGLGLLTTLTGRRRRAANER